MSKKSGYEAALSAENERHQAVFQQQVEETLALLAQDEVNKRNLEKRRKTILAIADAEADPTRSREDAFREPGVINRSTFYNTKKSWHANPLFKQVLDRVCAITLAYEERKDQRLREARRNAHREQMLAAANKTVNKLMAMLDFPLSDQVISDDGRTITIEAARWQMRDVAPMMNAADKAARLALDMDTKRDRKQLGDWKDEVIDALAAGDISADDVRAAYADMPDDVAEILARAELRSKSEHR